jgi:CsoR family transcriptional regulator, copper-sensing transcriptional repressor
MDLSICAYTLLESFTPRGYEELMEDDVKRKCAQRLSRIEGQVRGLARMVEEERYCIDIMTQIAAVQAALRKVEDELLKSHVSHCVEHAIKSGNAEDQRQKVAELIEVLGRRS